MSHIKKNNNNISCHYLMRISFHMYEFYKQILTNTQKKQQQHILTKELPTRPFQKTKN